MSEFNNLLHKFDLSFRSATKGSEDIKIVVRWWGILAYAFFYLIIDTLILKVNSRFFDLTLAWIAFIYFIWHIYALIKCSPKKPKLSKEEKKRLNQEKWKNASRSFMRKLLLQESISKWNPVTICIATDLLFISNFLGYILH